MIVSTFSWPQRPLVVASTSYSSRKSDKGSLSLPEKYGALFECSPDIAASPEVAIVMWWVMVCVGGGGMGGSGSGTCGGRVSENEVGGRVVGGSEVEGSVAGNDKFDESGLSCIGGSEATDDGDRGQKGAE